MLRVENKERAANRKGSGRKGRERREKGEEECGRCFRREISLAGREDDTWRRTDILVRRVAPLCYRLQYGRGPYCDLEVSISETSLSRHPSERITIPLCTTWFLHPCLRHSPLRTAPIRPDLRKTAIVFPINYIALPPQPRARTCRAC